MKSSDTIGSTMGGVEAIGFNKAGPLRVWVESAEADGFALGRRMATGVLPSGSSQDDSIKSRIAG